jgi:hypothetical protein
MMKMRNNIMEIVEFVTKYGITYIGKKIKKNIEIGSFDVDTIWFLH